MSLLRLDAAANDDAAVMPAVANPVRVRPLHPADLEAAQALSAEVKWPHRLEDWRYALAYGAGVVAECEGRVVGTALRWLWGNDRATVGLIIVSPEWQGQGVGRRLVEALLRDVGRRNVLLHATVEGQPLYERLGFRRVGEVCQHQGIATNAAPPVLARGERLRPPEPHEGDVLAALDVKATGLPRPLVVRRLLQEERVVVFERDGQAVGFSVLRRFGHGHAIGPVVAPDVASARALISHWCGLYAGRFIRIDVDAESGMPPWLESLGLKQVGTGTTMVRGKLPPRGPACGGWALITQAMG